MVDRGPGGHDSPHANDRDPERAVAPSLPAALRLGPVHLTVTDLDRSVAWYQESLGLRVHRHDAGEARLGDGEATTLVLVEEPQARRPGRTAGPLPLRAAVPVARGARPRGRPPLARPDADPGRLGPRDARGDLPRRPGRQRHRARRGPAARPLADAGGGVLGRRPAPARLRLAARDHRRRGAGAAGRRRPAHGAPAPARRRHRARARVLPRPDRLRGVVGDARARRSSRPGDTTITWASTPGAGRACRPRPRASSGCASGPWSCRRRATSRRCARGSRPRASRSRTSARGFLVRDPWAMALRVVEAGA